MILNKKLGKQILALMFLSLGGWLQHTRIHPISDNPSHAIPVILGIINVLMCPILFSYKKTVIIAYIINGFSVIIGTIIMAHLSITGFPEQLTFYHIAFKTTLADIFILLPKLFIAHLILQFYYPTGLGRIFTTVWWARHFCYVTIIYLIGHFI